MFVKFYACLKAGQQMTQMFFLFETFQLQRVMKILSIVENFKKVYKGRM